MASSCLVNLKAMIIFGLMLTPTSSFEEQLATFVTRPDLTVPLFDVDVYNGSALRPGYWLLAPFYEADHPDGIPSNPRFQAGPYIFDDQGDLVWSGSPLVNGLSTNDFKFHPSNEFSFLLGGSLTGDSGSGAVPYILNTSFEIEDHIAPPADDFVIDPHEFQIVDNGKSIIIKAQELNVTVNGTDSSFTQDRFQVVERHTQRVLFDWRSLDYISASESYIPSTEPDYFHLNSIEKTLDNNYLLSARHTNTIYLVSGSNGSVLWRLGGKSSSFTLNDFNFSAQHDARLLNAETPNITLISFLDNASDSQRDTSAVSSGLIVAIDHRNKNASVVSRFLRSDGHHTGRRGNVQVLLNGNAFVCWSQWGWIAEYDASGRCLMEAKFRNRRLATYRAFKMESPLPVSMLPSEDPILRIFASEAHEDLTSGAYVRGLRCFLSWNGAFSLSQWKLYGSDDSKSASWSPLKSFSKQGFETSVNLTTGRSILKLYAEGLDSSGSVLGRTKVATIDFMEDLKLEPAQNVKVSFWDLSWVSHQYIGDQAQRSLWLIICPVFTGIVTIFTTYRMYMSKTLSSDQALFLKHLEDMQ